MWAGIFPNWSGWKTTKGLLAVVIGFLPQLVPAANMGLANALVGVLLGVVVLLSGSGLGTSAVLRAAAKAAPVAILVFAATLAFQVSCKPAVSAIVTGVNAACAQLDSQPEPGWVYFACTVLDDAGNIINTYTAKVPASQAQAFALKNSSRAVQK